MRPGQPTIDVSSAIARTICVAICLGIKTTSSDSKKIFFISGKCSIITFAVLLQKGIQIVRMKKWSKETEQQIHHKKYRTHSSIRVRRKVSNSLESSFCCALMVAQDY